MRKFDFCVRVGILVKWDFRIYVYFYLFGEFVSIFLKIKLLFDEISVLSY